ncbi:type II toxin-antitoxin system VapB family antitoxin [Nocardia sp. CA-084685]|uniref:type II toxin-antitoxin system VapB family antitoxin n=1 Tax=Nocardia sp. CA-084685 TaxID=3239970 RepID=UPI003D97875C
MARPVIDLDAEALAEAARRLGISTESDVNAAPRETVDVALPLWSASPRVEVGKIDFSSSKWKRRVRYHA